MLLELKTLKQLIKNKSNVDISIVKDILQLDPTLKVDNIDDDTELGKYGEWLLGKLYKKYNQLPEDNKNTIKSDLLFYDYQIRSKRIPQEYDNIYKIKSIKELNDIVEKLQDNNNPLTQDPVTVAIGNHKFKTVSLNPFELLKKLHYGDIKESGITKWLVFNPKTKEESIVAGHNTSWCTARDDNKNLWDTYIYEGNTAWIFILSGKYKDANPDEYTRLVNNKLDKICIIVENGECQTRDNKLVELKLLPEIGDFIEDKIDIWTIKLANHDILSKEYRHRNGIKLILTGIKSKNNRLRLLLDEKRLQFVISKLPDRDKWFYLRNYPSLFSVAYNITDRLQSGIQDAGSVIYILTKNGIEINKDIQLLLVSFNGNLIYDLLKAGLQVDKDVIKLLVSQTAKLISHIFYYKISVNKDIMMLLVSLHGLLIDYILDAKIPIDKDIMMLLVTQNGLLIQRIIYREIPVDKDIMMLLVTQNGLLIEYISWGISVHEILIEQKDLYDIMMLLVSQNGWLIEYIKNPSKDIQMLLVSQNGYLIKYIKNPSKDVQLLLVSQDGLLIQYIINPSEEVQLLLIKQYVTLYGYIVTPTPLLTLLYKQLKGIKESTGYISKLLDVN